MHCSTCEMWSKVAPSEEGGGRREDVSEAGRPGTPMPLPPPAGVGGSASALSSGHSAVASCGRCEVEAEFHLLSDALDELQALDPLGYFATPVDEELIPEYRTVIPDPMDFGTMRARLHRGEYTREGAARPIQQGAARPIPEGASRLVNDFGLLCRNALVFNTKGDNPFRVAAKGLHKRGQEVLRCASTTLATSTR